MKLDLHQVGNIYMILSTFNDRDRLESSEIFLDLRPTENLS